MTKENWLLVEDDPRRGSGPIQAMMEHSGLRTVATMNLETFFGETLLDDEGFKGIVLNVSRFGSDELAGLLRLSQVLKPHPTILLAEKIDLPVFRRVGRLPHIVSLQWPLQTENFLELMGKIGAGLPYKPEVCERFVSEDPVRILVMNSGLLINSKIRNYSSGGAFLEYRGIGLGVGDHVQLSIPSATLKATQEARAALSARVIWIRGATQKKTAEPAGVGLQFVD